MTSLELAQYLDTLLHAKKVDERAYNGLQVANVGEITQVATAVSASRETIEKAVELGVQALIVHHGMFRTADQHPIIGHLYQKIALLITHNIALLGYHLPLDADEQFGNNWVAARALGLQDIQPCLSYNNVYIGVIGTIKPQPLSAFQYIAAQYYDAQPMTVAVTDTVSRVVIVSGKGYGCIKDAALLGADCFITGSFDEPVWDDAHDYGISFLGFGHYATEVIGVQAVAEHIQQQFNIRSTFIRTNNPF